MSSELDKNFVREKAGVEHMFGSFPRENRV